MNQDQFSVYLVSLKTLDNQALINDILQKYYEQIEARTRQLLNYFAQISLLGPISFISPQLSQQNKQYHDKLVHIRQDYEMLIGTYEQKFRDNMQIVFIFRNFTKEYIQNFVNQFKNSVGDENYLAYINDQINQEYIINLDQENWINYMSQIIDVQTIQEINQTQILYVSDSDKKIAFNYDGDEEKTPIQSEQEYSEKQNNKYIKKKQDKNEDNLSEKDGYDASNSDHSKNKSKTTRALRIQRKKNQNPNAEFDTDRERGNKKS
ncbi:hypothetical protein pb186bvf_009395 [Paramecium bursaria]